MNHSEYQKKVKKMTVAELMYLAKDAREAAEAYPEGINAGYYTDEMHYAAMELRRRQK